MEEYLDTFEIWDGRIVDVKELITLCNNQHKEIDELKTIAQGMFKLLDGNQTIPVQQVETWRKKLKEAGTFPHHTINTNRDIIEKHSYPHFYKKRKSHTR